MIDETLSSAVVTFVWGNPGRPWPSQDVEAVQENFGEKSSDLIPRIEKIFALVWSVPLDWSSEDLSTATERIELLVRSHHPELSDEAVRAICNHFHYCWK